MGSVRCAPFCAVVLCTLVLMPVLVSGNCEILDPPRCDLKSKKIVSSVQFNGTCAEKDIPKLFIGDTYELNISFTPAQDAKYAKSEVKVEVLGLLIPVDLENPDACVNKGLDCPLKADTHYTFNTVFQLDPSYPVYSELHAKIRWSLVDEPADSNSDDDDKTIWCIRLAVYVEPKETALLKYEEPSFRVVP